MIPSTSTRSISVELICDIEDAEGIDFGEPEGLETIGDIVEHIDSLK